MSVFVGVDVSKPTLVVTAWPGNDRIEVRNGGKGLTQLVRWLEARPVERILLEATGGYEKRVLAVLAARWPVVRVRADRARAFATAMGAIAKTDRLDAALLARQAAQIEGPLVSPPEPARERLQALVRRREQLVGHRDDERRRLQQADDPFVRTSLKRSIAWAEAEIARFDREIKQAVSACGDVRAEQLSKVKGIGAVTVATLVAFLPELGRLDNRKISALVGVAPYNSDSGARQGRRRIQDGRAGVRRTLYMATWIAIRFNPDLKARYESLRARGKCAKVAIVACMRTLIVRLNAMVRDGSEWKGATA